MLLSKQCNTNIFMQDSIEFDLQAKLNTALLLTGFVKSCFTNFTVMWTYENLHCLATWISQSGAMRIRNISNVSSTCRKLFTTVPLHRLQWAHETGAVARTNHCAQGAVSGSDTSVITCRLSTCDQKFAGPIQIPLNVKPQRLL